MRAALAAIGMLLLEGCRAFDATLLQPSVVPLPVRLPALTAEVRIQQLRSGRDSAAVSHDVQTFFARELREVIATPGDSARGVAVLNVRRVRYGQGWLYSYLSGLSLGSLPLLGFPLARYHGLVDVQLDIRNRRGELVGTYYGQGKARVMGGLYRRTNYAEADMVRAVYLQCVRQGLAQIRPQLQADLPQLQAELLN